MKISTFGFLTRRGVRNLGKHWAMTIACIASLSVCMTLNIFASLIEVNVDSMVSHYSVAKIPRAEDEYSPGGKGGARPDRSATVYTRLAKQAYPDLPVILGGLEASLRRFAHYDYWLDTVLPSIAEDSGADIISFGMGEHLSLIHI